jgi:hypothetical protein
VTSQETSLAIEKHEKRKKIARLDFSGAKGVVHLSSDYYIIDGNQTPTSNKGGLPTFSKSAELTSKSAKPIAACSESARSTSQSARPIASTACPESARPTSQLARPTASTAIVPASAQVGLADFIDFGSCRCVFG